MKMVFVATEKERKFKMPKKYIEREALVESIKNRFKKLIDEGYVYEEIVECNAEILELIISLPTADVVEVVRCKDCKYHGEDETGYWCNRMFNSHKTVEDNFCKFGAKMIRSKNND